MSSAAPRALALCAHHLQTGIMAYEAAPGGGVQAVSCQQFLADVQSLAAQLPPHRFVLNLCKNRYRFLVGLAAAIVTQRICLLPSTYTPLVLEQVEQFAPDVFFLLDASSEVPKASHLPRVMSPLLHAPLIPDATMPVIDAAQIVAYVFTSGSTGVPVPHAKTWGKLVLNTQGAAKRLGFAPGTCLVGTVPSQHMYGFESTVLLALLGHCALWSGHPFYPADVLDALNAVPEPKVLVSTPVHLRALLGETPADAPVSPVAAVLCATAPLPQSLAIDVEARLHAPLLEIYGSTETGQIAVRRSAQTLLWELFDEVQLSEEDGCCHASGGHIERRIAMQDVIEIQDARHFLLLGRHADLINIAGKRNSLGNLNHQLLAIPGIVDGCVFLPDAEPAALTDNPELPDAMRICAVVVAPGLRNKDILQALRERVEAVFLPRPLIQVDSLPRNATGKLPKEWLQALWQRHQADKQVVQPTSPPESV